jgi:ribosomal protein S18 acetylase RimI-like enzyme
MVEIRAATTDDIPAVLAVWERARSPAAVTPDTPEAVERLLAHDPGALLIAESDGKVAGVLICGWDGWRGAMYRLGVLPEHRRHGIGRALVEAGQERLVALGAVRAGLQIAAGEEAAEGLWREAGWAHDTTVARWARTF